MPARSLKPWDLSSPGPEMDFISKVNAICWPAMRCRSGSRVSRPGHGGKQSFFTNRSAHLFCAAVLAILLPASRSHAALDR